MRQGWARNAIVYVLIAAALGALFFNVVIPQQGMETVDITAVAREVRAGNVQEITVEGNDLTMELKNGSTVRSVKEQDIGLPEFLRTLDVTPAQIATANITYAAPSQWNSIAPILASFIPLLIIGGFLFFMLRQAQGSNNQAMNFGKSRARLFTSDKPTVTFGDVAGVEEAKQELSEIVEFLKEPEKFVNLGARIPKGVLMIGPPGTGKTLMARAVAGEAGVPFFSISGSEFVEMFVGVGASRVRDLFEQAKRNSPCIIFIDEIDAVGRQRGAGLGGSHDEREQTLNQILVEMDGFDSETNVIVIAATNRPDILDPALLRPGRFDRRVTLDRPDLVGRRAILDVHTKGKPLGKDVDLQSVASSTPGLSGADIENLVNEAAILTARRNKKAVGMSEMQEAIERVLMGPERKSRLISAKEKRIIAYREAGAAMVRHSLTHCDPIRKITIVSRGSRTGYVFSSPINDNFTLRRSKFMHELAAMLAGRLAEQTVFGTTTDGSAVNLERASNVARSMVTRYGMSERLGPMVFGEREEMIFLGREISEQRNYSENVAELIDDEVRAIIEEASGLAQAVIDTRRADIELVAKALMDKEGLNHDEFVAVLEGRTPTPPAARPPQRTPQPKATPEGDSGLADGDISFSPAPA